MREPNLGRLLWVSFATDAAHAEIHRCPLRPKTDRQPLEHNLSGWAISGSEGTDSITTPAPRSDEISLVLRCDLSSTGNRVVFGP